MDRFFLIVELALGCLLRVLQNGLTNVIADSED